MAMLNLKSCLKYCCLTRKVSHPFNTTVRYLESKIKKYKDIVTLADAKENEFPADGVLKKCTMIPGDGIGPEISAAVEEIFEAIGVPIEFDYLYMSEVNPRVSVSMDKVLKSVRKNKICLKGAMEMPKSRILGEEEEDILSLNMKFKKELDLFARVAHIRSLPGVKTRFENLDFHIIREQMEGEYSALEHQSAKGVVESLRIVTRERSLRIADFAFRYTSSRGLAKLYCVHKANIMKLSDGLFLQCCLEVSKKFPEVEFESIIVDNFSMQLVSNPKQFDVMVMPNLYGNIMINLGCGLVGGAGLVASENHNPDSTIVVYESGAAHTYTGAAGKNKANPVGFILCATKMLRMNGFPMYAAVIYQAVGRVLREGRVRTPDLGGQASMADFTRAVIKNIKN